MSRRFLLFIFVILIVYSFGVATTVRAFNRSVQRNRPLDGSSDFLKLDL